MKSLKPKFLLAENLSRLAKWLRLLGYDTVVYKSISYHNMVRLALKDSRIILTRSKKDADLKRRFSRRLIVSDKHLGQLEEIKDLLQLNNDKIFTRCLICNRILYDISKNKIQDFVPEFVWERHSKFKICRKCGKIYWQGTHYKDMLNKLKKIFCEVEES